MSANPAAEASEFDRFLAHIQANPPVSFAFHYRGCESNDTVQSIPLMISIVAQLLLWAHPHLEFIGLDNILVYDDFDAAVTAACTRVLCPIPDISPNGSVSAAVTVTGPGGSDLVLRKDIALGLLAKEEALRNYSANALRHELCHVDDNRHMRRTWPTEWGKQLPATIHGSLHPSSLLIWAEYYANRFSADSDVETILHAEELRLADALDRASVLAETAIATAIEANDVSLVPHVVGAGLALVCQELGYVHGHHAALGNREPITKELREALADYALPGFFDETRAAVDRMLDTRLDWKTSGCLVPLTELLFTQLVAWHILYENTETGATMRVLRG